MSNLKIRERLKEIKKIKNSLIQDQEVPRDDGHFPLANRKYGISVIIPIHRSEKFIEGLIESINIQTLDKNNFEVLFIFNGDYETSENIFNNMSKSFQHKILYSEKGVGRARNLGINESLYSYITFLDADDTLSSDYLENSLSESEPFAILLNQLHEVVDGRDDNGNNVINKEIQNKNQYPNKYFDVGKNLSLNGAKVIPTNFLLHRQFDEELNNGEDVALYAEIVTVFKPIVKINQKNAIYYRYKGQGTLSRAKVTFQFNVLDRIHVIDLMQDSLRYEDDLDVRNFLIDRMRSQALFINKYLMNNMSDYKKVTDLIKIKQDEFYPYQQVNKDLAKTLYISYCFPPFVDTSGVVMAKRINKSKQPVDVVFNDMTTVRNMDPSLEFISNPYIDTRHMINTPSSFSNSAYIRAFVDKTIKRTDISKYNTLYSRALWPGSHLAAFNLKTSANQINWIAEFSDPIMHDILNNERKSNYFSIKEVNKIKKAVPEKYQKYLDTNLFNMVEVLPFIFADELVFTNRNQQEIMLERFDQDFREMVEKKSSISEHPSLDEYYYNIEKNYINLDKGKFNIGYFGNFYETRSSSDIIKIAEKIKELDIDAQLYIFTNDTSKVKSQVMTKDVTGIVKVDNYLKYFEFLNASKEFDCLIISDANTKEYKNKNPYLPSKLSDYVASGTKIWALYEKNSMLHSKVKQTDANIYGSELGDVSGIEEILKLLYNTTM